MDGGEGGGHQLLWVDVNAGVGGRGSCVGVGY